MSLTFENDDLLGRQDYANFLITLIRRSKDIRKQAQAKSFRIAIDASWGVGKTQFAEMLKTRLEETASVSENGGIKTEASGIATKDKEFYVVYYNALDSDYWSNAFDPFISAVAKSDIFQLEDDEKLHDQIIKIAVEIIKKLGTTVAKQMIGNIPGVGSIFGKLFEAIESVTIAPDKQIQTDFEKMENQVEAFKSLLKEVVERSGKKLVIIIDDLDQCKPTFAIQVLEASKHLFNIENVVFVYLLDICQLSCTVRSIYGEGFDASGYLCHSFDYLGKLPQADISKLIELRISEFKFFENLQHNSNVNYIEFKNQFISAIVRLYQDYNLNFKTLEVVLTAYQIMTKAFLSHYQDVHAHIIYIFLLILKNKDISLYSELFSEQNVEQEFYRKINKKNRLPSIAEINDFIRAIAKGHALSECSFNVYRADGQETQELPVHIVGIKKVSAKKYNVEYAYDGEIQPREEKLYFRNWEYNWGKVLFFEDLLKWDMISSLTLRQYYFQQLEMFDFVLPIEDNPTIE